MISLILSENYLNLIHLKIIDGILEKNKNFIKKNSVCTYKWQLALFNPSPNQYENIFTNIVSITKESIKQNNLLKNTSKFLKEIIAT